MIKSFLIWIILFFILLIILFFLYRRNKKIGKEKKKFDSNKEELFDDFEKGVHEKIIPPIIEGFEKKVNLSK